MQLVEENIPRNLAEQLDVLAGATIPMSNSALTGLSSLTTAGLTVTGSMIALGDSAIYKNIGQPFTFGSIVQLAGIQSTGGSFPFNIIGYGNALVFNGLASDFGGDVILNGNSFRLDDGTNSAAAINWDGTNHRASFGGGINLNGTLEAFWEFARFYQLYCWNGWYNWDGRPIILGDGSTSFSSTANVIDVAIPTHFRGTINGVFLHGGPLYLNDASGTGGDYINFEGGEARNLTAISGVSGSQLNLGGFASGIWAQAQLVMQGNPILMDDGSGSGGAGLYMGGGAISGIGGINNSDGTSGMSTVFSFQDGLGGSRTLTFNNGVLTGAI